MGHEFNIDCVEKIYFLKRRQGEMFQRIYIDSRAMIISGVLHHAIKYAYWHLYPSGELIVKCPDSAAQGFSPKNPCKWQVFNLLALPWYKKNIIYRCVGNDIHMYKMGLNNYTYNGVSIGIVFSGTADEEKKLIDALSDIDKPIDINYEVVICGPSGYDFSVIKNKFNNLNVKYIEYNEKDVVGSRFLISRKKNFIYHQLMFDVRVISHTRIRYPRFFFEELLKNKFDIAGPIVNDLDGFRYLDLVLIGSYDTSKLNTERTLTSIIFTDDYLNYMKSRVAYIDGGIIVINSKVIDGDPFCDDVAWGEGEDVELAKRSYNGGLLVDIIENVQCVSLIRKFPHKKGLLTSLKHALIRNLGI